MRSACAHFHGKGLQEAEQLRPVADRLAAVCGYAIEHYTRVGVAPEIYGDIYTRLRILERAFLCQAEQ
jgi:hypothetical protein